MDLITFVPDMLLILVVTVYVLGMFFKQVPMVKDKYIPIILLTFSVVFAVLIEGFVAQSILQGIIVWGVATGGYDIVHQLNKK